MPILIKFKTLTADLDKNEIFCGLGAKNNARILINESTQGLCASHMNVPILSKYHRSSHVKFPNLKADTTSKEQLFSNINAGIDQKML
jgi:hypothetical protein